MTMQAIILSVQCDGMLVLDLSTSTRVRVHYGNSCRFRVGSRVCIRYNGVMTRSIPPQITANRITVLPLFGGRCR